MADKIAAKQSRTSVMLARYSYSMMAHGDVRKHPALARALHRWVKKWWAGLSARTRGEVSRRLRAGSYPLTQHFVGAPAMVGLLKVSRPGVLTSTPTPRSARVMFDAAKKRARKARGRQRRREMAKAIF